MYYVCFVEMYNKLLLVEKKLNKILKKKNLKLTHYRKVNVSVKFGLPVYQSRLSCPGVLIIFFIFLFFFKVPRCFRGFSNSEAPRNRCG